MPSSGAKPKVSGQKASGPPLSQADGEPSSDENGHAAVTQLRAYLAQRDTADTRLPPERELCELLGVSRGELRKALAIMEREGQLWRHVGKGTFVGERPDDWPTDLRAIAARTNPAEVFRTRLIVEPEIAREAALNATSDEIAAMHRMMKRSRVAQSWRQYESLDNQLHRQIAAATHNTVVLMLFDALNVVRRTVVWGRLRVMHSRPPDDHHSFAEHERIVEAISERDREGATRAMRDHLRSVEYRLTHPT
jgi:GntR family transcriptional regulator, uxu operon transcriptional repressor